MTKAQTVLERAVEEGLIVAWARTSGVYAVRTREDAPLRYVTGRGVRRFIEDLRVERALNARVLRRRA